MIKYTPQKINYTLILLLLILLLGFSIRVYELDQHNYYNDEDLSITRASDSIPNILKGYMPFPLHYIFIHIAYYFGNDPFILRFPSVIFGVLGIFLIYKIGSDFFDKNTGLISAFLLAISPASVYYSQMARYYSFFMFFSLLTLYFLYKLIKDPKGVWIVGFIVSTLLNFFTHGYSLFVLIVEMFFITILFLRSHTLEKLTKTISNWRILCIFGLFIIFILFLLIQTSYLKIINSIIIFNPYYQTPGLELSLPFFTGIFEFLGSGSITHMGGVEINPALYFLFFIIGLFYTWKKDEKIAILTVLWIVLPFMILFLIKTTHFFSVRYIVFMIPIYLIMVSNGIVKFAGFISEISGKMGIIFLKRCTNLSIILLFIGILAINPLIDWHNWKWGDDIDPRDWGGVSVYLKENVKPGDVIFAEDHRTIDMLSYLLNNTSINSNLLKYEDLMTPQYSYLLGINGLYRPTVYLIDNKNTRVWFVRIPRGRLFERNYLPNSFSWTLDIIEEKRFSKLYPIDVYELGLKGGEKWNYYTLNYSIKSDINKTFEAKNIYLDEFYQFIFPEKQGTSAHIIYKIKSEDIKELVVTPVSVVTLPKSYLKVYRSFDGIEYTLLYEIKNNTGPIQPQISLLGKINESKNDIYLKIELFVDNESFTPIASRVEKLTFFYISSNGQLEVLVK